MEIRLYKDNDLNEILELFYNTVHLVNCKDYTNEQLDAWAPKEQDLDRWKNKFENTYSLVVEENNEIIGFGNIDDFGYLDCLYVHHLHNRKGIGKLLLESLEAYAKSKNCEKIEVDVSITALKMFEHFNYRIIQEQHVIRKNVCLINYHMEKLFNSELNS